MQHFSLHWVHLYSEKEIRSNNDEHSETTKHVSLSKNFRFLQKEK